MLTEDRRSKLITITEAKSAGMTVTKADDNRGWIMGVVRDELKRQLRVKQYRPVYVADPDSQMTEVYVKGFLSTSGLDVEVKKASGYRHNPTWEIKVKPEPEPAANIVAARGKYKHVVGWDHKHHMYPVDVAVSVAQKLVKDAAGTGVVHVVGVPDKAKPRDFADDVKTFVTGEWEDQLIYSPTHLAVWMDKTLSKKVRYKVTPVRGEEGVWKVEMKPTYSQVLSDGKRIPNAMQLARRGVTP